VIGNKNMKIGNVRMEMSHFLSQFREVSHSLSQIGEMSHSLSQIGEVSHSLQKAVWFES
jgi:hypothetical protein